MRTRTAAWGNVLALLALVAQLALPSIQGWHDARERSVIGDRSAAASIATSNDGSEHIGATAGRRTHDSDTCPVCRLISQTHTALVVAGRYEIGTTLLQHSPVAPHQALPEAQRCTVAAPRAPPAFLG